MILSPILYAEDEVANVAGLAIDLASTKPLTKRCTCPVCGVAILRMIGLGAIDGERVSLIDQNGMHAAEYNGKEPLTFAIVSKCVNGHTFSSVFRQVGQEIHCDDWQAD